MSSSFTYPEPDTICAPATAPGGALGVIRISGPQATTIADAVFRPAAGSPLGQRRANAVVFGNICASDGTVVDEVLATRFVAPHSYTGEDSVEFSCHGSAYILRTVLQLLTENGARMARPGEYTRRAFLNGKMDLSQAEAVADLIAADSAAAHRMALNQMRGNYSREFALLRDKLLHITSLLELELDFSDHEDLEFADRTQLDQLADQIETKLAKLCASFRLGNALKNGIPVAIVGETNAGKSTLLNALLGEERAIVSDIHGTTRDVIEDTIVIDGQTFRFIDTAGIRHTTDTIENLGIARTFEKMEQADVVLWLIDATAAREQFTRLADSILSHLGQDRRLVLLLNKSDLCTEVSQSQPSSANPGPTSGHQSSPSALSTDFSAHLPVGTPILHISAHNSVDVDHLRALLSEMVPQTAPDTIIVSNARHYEALNQALDAIRRVRTGLTAHLSGDFVSQDLRECLYHLSDIIGEVTPTQVLTSVFERFCIGK